MIVSAGLLPYRRRNGLEVLLAHPGGPFFANKDEGAWSVVKGIVEDGEANPDAARREFEEETGWTVPEGSWIPLGSVRLRSGKQVEAWAIEAEFDPDSLRPGLFTMQLRGRQVTFPEIDRVAWFGPDEAYRRINPAQRPLLDRLSDHLATGDG